MDFTKKENDRRTKARFGIERDMRYKMLDQGVVVASGTGQTVNMGSGGIAFSAEQQFAPGGFVELSISWPVLLDDTCPMRLIVFGRILRCSENRVACTLDKYEFRTQARNVLPIAPPRSDAMLQRWADGVRKENVKIRMAQA
jgi:hypothetical protein